MDANGTYSRGYLPHIKSPGAPVFITFRLNDALPRELVKKWKLELESQPKEEREAELWRMIEDHIDAGSGSCLLREPQNACIVQDAFKFGHESGWYRLHDWVVMPNHVHLLLDANHTKSVGEIVQSLKRFTSRHIGENGRLWQPDYFDRTIRDEEHLRRVTEYIAWNPAKAKLCSDPKHFPFSSSSEENETWLKLTQKR